MVTKTDYPKDAVEACLSVMVELMTLLGEFRNNIVLVGGWVPYFLVPEKKQEHTGSLDIDIALDFKKISEHSYKTILHLLQERRYVMGEQPFIFYRSVTIATGIPVKVEIDLLAGEYGGTGTTHRTQKVQEVKARKARGCDLAFESTFTVKLCARMPDGARNEVAIRISGVVPFFVMKGMALWERYKEKHAYDVYFTILNYPGGTPELVKIFKPFLSNKLVQEGLGKIKAKFIEIDAPGPMWVVNFEEIDDEEERERVRRDVFERVNILLDSLNIKPFQEG